MSDQSNAVTDAETLTLLLDSLEQPEEQRIDWVRQQQHYTKEIQAEVLKILQRNPDSGLFDTPFQAGPDDSDRVGQVVGDYQLQQLIGQGGMGAVYLAARIRDFEHQCAIKLIRSGKLSETSREYFARERQSLADMQHPYIAHLLDGGTTSDGDEYFVMEWVAGQSITEYCKAGKLSEAGILDVFQKVCQALEYAHAKLLVHGDIKPSNILVTTDGTPKLLDFGIAQHLQQPLDQRQRAVTRNFASPEQLAHKKLTVTSDIYSLCTMLQVLLCGNTETASSGYLQLPAELRSIIEKGRSYEPDKRYTSVTRLLQDCTRYRQHQPVTAHSDRWGYRAGKFIQRNRVLVTAGTLLAISLITGAVVSLWQAQEALFQKQQAEQFSETLVGLLNAPDPYADGSARTVEDMLDRAEQQLLAESSRLPDQVQSDLLLTLGQVYVNIDAMEKARNIAYALEKKWSGSSHSDSKAYANAHQFIGIMASRTGEYPAAREALEKAFAWYQRHDSHSQDAADNIYELGRLYLFSGEEQQARELWAEQIIAYSAVEQPWVNLWLAQIYNDLGIADEFLGELESAREHYLLSIEYFPSKQSLAAATQLGNLASVERKMGQVDRAIELLNRSLQMHYDVVGPDHKEVSMILSDLALAYLDNQQASIALPYARQALDNALENSGAMHRNTAAAYFALGNAEMLDGNLETARQHLQQALTIRQELLGEEHERTLDVAISLAAADCANSTTAAHGDSQLSEIIRLLSSKADNNQFYITRALTAKAACNAN